MRAGRHSWQRALFDACNTFFQQANAPIECGDEFETDEEIQKVHFGRELLGVIKGETPDLDAIQKVHFGSELLGVIKGETPDLDAKLVREISSTYIPNS